MLEQLVAYCHAIYCLVNLPDLGCFGAPQTFVGLMKPLHRLRLVAQVHACLSVLPRVRRLSISRAPHSSNHLPCFGAVGFPTTLHFAQYSIVWWTRVSGTLSAKTPLGA
jgi:hypothetical protein